MKYRIIERGDGKFKVQSKAHWLDKWKDEYLNSEDYPDSLKKYSEWEQSQQYKDRWEQVFSNIELAQEKIKNITEKKNIEKLKKQFKVIEEVEV